MKLRKKKDVRFTLLHHRPYAAYVPLANDKREKWRAKRCKRYIVVQRLQS